MNKLLGLGREREGEGGSSGKRTREEKGPKVCARSSYMSYSEFCQLSRRVQSVECSLELVTEVRREQNSCLCEEESETSSRVT